MPEKLPWTREDLRACHLADFQAHAVRKAAERCGYVLRVGNGGHHWQFRLDGGLIEWWPSRGRYAVNKIYGERLRTHPDHIPALLEKWAEKVPQKGAAA